MVIENITSAFSGLTPVLILAIVAILLFIGVARKMFKDKGTRKNVNLLAIGLVVIIGIGILVPGANFLINPINLGGGDVPLAVTPTQLTPSGICAVEDTTITLSSTDMFTSGSAGTTHRYRINGAPALTLANTGSFTASPYDRLEILWGNETDTNYFGFAETVTVPCSGTKTFSTELVQQPGNVTISVFNEEGLLISATANNESLDAGDVVTLEAKLKGQFNRGLPYGGIIIVEYNKTAFDDVIVDFGGTKVPVPSIYTITKGTVSETKAYSIPAFLSNEILIGSVVIDVTGMDVASGEEIILQWRANDYFINEDTGGSFDGPAVQDEDDAVTFPDEIQTYIITTS